MSQENVEIERRMLEASDRRDGEAVFAAYDPDIEFDMSEIGAVAGVEDWQPDFPRRLPGRDALRAALHEWVSAWEIVDYEHEELIDAGDHVAASNTAMKAYADRAEALEAAGLEE
jgi:ketosteroid isomerase-like protein